MNIGDFRPRSMLVKQETAVSQPRFPVIDVHNHLGEFGGGWCDKPVAAFVDALDEANVVHFVDLDGGWGEDVLQARLEKYKAAIPQRYRVFGGVHWDAWPAQGNKFGEYAAARLRQQAAWGAQGLKIWKPFGLHVRDQTGQLVAVDDPRLDPLWAAAGELNLPVMVHVADPVAFFQPLTATNERWEEMHNHPDWQFPSPPFPPFRSLVDGFANIVRRHPRTTFIGAHVGCYAENLGWVSNLLEECPNFYIDISARIGELGRQPYTTRRLFMHYADRILFGIDAGPNADVYRLYYRFLETDDEYFNYSLNEPPPQGRWHIYGINLPDDVLEKIYAANAKRLFLTV